MSLGVRIGPPAPGPLPTLRWNWEPETDILGGTFLVPGSTGFTGPVEISDDDGSVVVIDVAGGVICGLDVAVWPEVVMVPDLAPPLEAPTGQALVPARPRPDADDPDTTLSMAADAEGRVYHLRIGTRRTVDVVRVADHLWVEVDRRHHLAGLWATGVPLRPGLDDLI